VERAVVFHTLSPFPEIRASLLVSRLFTSAGFIPGDRERLKRSLGFSFPGDSEDFVLFLVGWDTPSRNALFPGNHNTVTPP